MSGFIKLWRGWRDNPALDTVARRDAWIWLIENACWKPTRFNVKGKTITLERGQICASREQLATEWGWSESAVERFLTRLKTEQMLGRETGQGKSIITICNYNKYQDKPDATEQETGRETGQRSDRDRTAKEESKKVKKEETEPKGSISRGQKAEKPDGVGEDVWTDFLAHRKQKRAAVTRTAIAGIEREAVKAGMTMDAVFRMMMARGWQGFQAEWVKETNNGNRGSTTTRELAEQVAAELSAAH